jgi:hypothetical protein
VTQVVECLLCRPEALSSNSSPRKKVSRQRKAKDQMDAAEFHQPFKELFHEIERERILPNSSYEASINLIPKLEGDTTKKKSINQFL